MSYNQGKGTQYTYLIVRLSNGRYENWGAYTTEGLQIALSEAIKLPNVDGFVFSNIKNEDKKRNRRLMLGLNGRRGRIPSLRAFMFKSIR